VPAGRHRKTARWTPQRLAAAAAATFTVAMAVPVAAAAVNVTTAAQPTDQVLRPQAPEAVRADIRSASRSSNRLGLSMLSLPRPKPVTVATEPVELKTRWTTTRLNVWSRPSEKSKLLKVLDPAVKVPFTGEVKGAWAQIQLKDKTTWVRKEYLVAKKPSRQVRALAGVSGVSGAPCPDGSSVESGLQSNTVKLYRAVCAAFPAVSSWGGASGSGDHGAGRALDIMCSGPLGDAIAEYVRANASAFGVSEVIWSQRIWSTIRSGEGWRGMEDRGSSTANHYDHVHVSVN
jgi:hypothetical protein